MNHANDHQSKFDRPRLSVKSITKLFGDFAACKSIDFEILPGEIHALLGENGAGKSTLVKMLYGSLQPSSGVINWDEKPIVVKSPAFARELGIGMVFQHFSLFDALSVAENIALSMPGNMSVDDVAVKADEFSKKYGLPLNTSAIVGDLSVGERQRVEIIRCLLQEPTLLILDEPTSVLTPQEAENLFQTIDLLKAEGRSILFISHRLEEVRTHCDRATILRFGEVVGSCNPREETAASLARMMVGTDVKDLARNGEMRSSEPVLRIQGLNQSAETPYSVALDDIHLTVHAGEIVGLAGVAGNGQSELFEALSGERIAGQNNAVEIRGKPLGNAGINERRKAGAAFVPEERNGHGAVAGFRLNNNMLLSRHASDSVAFLKWGGFKFLKMDLVQKASQRVCEENDVRRSGENPFASSLSGGNLQKYVMGRELDRQPSLLVVNQPSWGVDAGAAQRIRQSLVDLAANGSGVLVISQDLDEVLEISDRVAVLFDGKLSDAVPVGEITREGIGLLMAGVNPGLEEGTGHHAA